MKSQEQTKPAWAASGEDRFRWGPLMVVLAPVFMVGLDVFIVNVSMPSIQQELDATSAQVQFISSGFSLAYGAGLITGGRLGDLYGRRRLFMLGLGLFVLASAAGGAAPTAGLLVGARLGQGLGAALMAPQALAVLGLLYPGAHRARALGAYALTIGLSAVLGQVVGGLLVQADLAGLGWRAVFVVNVPIGVAALLLAPGLIPDSRSPGEARLDLPGALLVTAATVTLVFPLILGTEQGWPPWTLAGPPVSVALVAVFVGHQRRLARGGGSPLIDPALFRQRSFVAGLATVVLFHAAMASFFLVFTYWLQRGAGLSALRTGLNFLLLSAGFLAAARTSGRLVGRLRHQTLAVGTLTLAAGYGLLAVTVSWIGERGPVAWLTPGLIVAGFGMGTVLAPLVSLVLADIPARSAATASGALTTAMQVGNATGVAVVGIVFYGTLGEATAPRSYTEAFTGSTALLIALALAVAVMVQFFTRRRRGRHAQTRTRATPAAPASPFSVPERVVGPRTGSWRERPVKALVLSGGSGTRLRPITHSRAKQLVPVANKPVLFYGLEAIAEAGIEEVGIVVGHTAAEIEEAVGDGSAFGLRVTYIQQEEPLGLAHAVLIAREFLGDDDFVMYLGDNFVIGGITGLVEDFRVLRPTAQILLTQVPDPSAFGVAELDHAGNVVRLEEKPEHPKSDLALVGVYLFTPAVHEAVDAIKPSARGELEITDALQWLIDQGRDVRSSVIHGYWKDTGNVTDMLEANRVVLEGMEGRIDGEVDDTSQIIGRVRIAAGARIRNSRIVGPVTIGAGTVIEDSYIGPFTSVDHSCAIHGSEIEFSIILPEASIEGVGRIEASLIGRQVQVAPSPRAPAAHRLVLGDHSKVQIRS